MTIPIEIVLLRNYLPRSRPTNFTLELSNSQTGVKLFPGAASMGEHVWVELTDPIMVSPYWMNIKATVYIDNIKLSDPRPGGLWTLPTDIPSGLIQFPPMALPENRMLGGWHTLCLRTVE